MMLKTVIIAESAEKTEITPVVGSQLILIDLIGPNGSKALRSMSSRISNDIDPT